MTRRFYVFDIELTGPDRFAQAVVEGRQGFKVRRPNETDQHMGDALAFGLHPRFKDHYRPVRSTRVGLGDNFPRLTDQNFDL